MDGYVDEGEISLKDEESALYTSLINQQTREPPYDEETMLRPNKGFAGHTPAVTTSRDIPKTMQMALNHPDNHQWRQAMEKEYEKLESKDIFELVQQSDVPQGVQIFPGKWVFDSKENYEPTDERAYKARWVILSNLIDKKTLQFDYCTYTLVVTVAVI